MAQQIERKFIKDNAIDGSKLQLSNNQAVRAKNTSGADVEILKYDDSNKTRMYSAPIVANESSEGKALQTKDQIDAAIAASIAEIALTPTAQVRYVAKNGNDSTATGSIDKPFLTIKAAQASISDAGPTKRYVIYINPGLYQEADDFAIGSDIVYYGIGNAAGVQVRHATLATPIESTIGASGNVTLLNFRIQSPFKHNQTAATANGLLEMVNMVFAAFEIAVGAAGFGLVYARYSRFTSTITSTGPVQFQGYYNQLGANVSFGHAAPTEDQGFVLFAGGSANAGATITVNGATLVLQHAFFDGVTFDTKGFANDFIHDVASLPSNSAVSVSGTGAGRIRINDVANLKFTPAVSGNWSVAPTEPKGALDELASRVKSAETNKANTDLGNLVTTAVNVNLLPALDDASLNLGSGAKRWGGLWLNDQFGNVNWMTTGGGSYKYQVGPSQSTPSGLSGFLIHGRNTMTASDVLGIVSENRAGAGVNTNTIVLETGNHQSTSASSGSGDIKLRTGSVAGSNLRGEISLLGRQVNVNSTKVVNLADGTVSSDGINKGQLDTAVATLQSQITASNTSLDWKQQVFLISEDAELAAAAEGDALSSILPFLDDESPSLVLGDFSAGLYLIAANGASSKIMKVIDDAGTLKVSFVDVTPLAEGHTFIVKHDLIDSPASNETRAIYNFTGSEMVKLGDFDWALASGIVLSPAYNAVAGIVTVGDSIEVAIGKLVANLGQVQQDLLDAIAAEEAARQGADAVLETRIEALEDIAAYKNSKVLDSTDITNQYLDLAHEIEANTLNLFVGRLALHETEDYTLSVEGGVTRVTFVNSIATGGDEALEADMKLFWNYLA